jgi:very-short-patch-repair endonuclease
MTNALATRAWQPLAARRAQLALDLADAACESPGESLTRLILNGLRLPYESQVPLYDERGLIGRVDFLVAGRVVVEFDGLVKYAGAEGREALAAEKRREDRLRRAGYAVVRITWAELSDPAALVRRIRAAHAQAVERRL